MSTDDFEVLTDFCLHIFAPSMHFIFSANFRTECMPRNGTNSANFNDVEIKLLFNSKGERLHIIQLFLFVVYFNRKIYFQVPESQVFLDTRQGMC